MMTRMKMKRGARPDPDVHGELAAARAETDRLTAHVQDLDDRLELVLAASGTGVWEWQVANGSLSGRTRSASSTDCRRERAGGLRRLSAMIHPEDRDAFLRSRSAVRSRQASRTTSSSGSLWPDGSVHWTHGAGRAFYDVDGRPQRMIGTGQDITERRELEIERDGLVVAEHRANEWREAFIAVLSHELRTPITTILGASSVLARPTNPDLDDRRRELLDDIVGEAGRLDRIVSDLVVLSQAERGVLESVCEPLELRRVVQRVVQEETRRWPEVHLQPRRRSSRSRRARGGDVRGAGPAQHAGQCREVRPGGRAHPGRLRRRTRRGHRPRPGRRSRIPRRTMPTGCSSPSIGRRRSPGRSAARGSACSCAPASSKRWVAGSGRWRGPRAGPSSALHFGPSTTRTTEPRQAAEEDRPLRARGDARPMGDDEGRAPGHERTPVSPSARARSRCRGSPWPRRG